MRGEGGWDVRGGGQRQHRGKATDVMQHNPQVVLSFSLHLLLAQSHTHTHLSFSPTLSNIYLWSSAVRWACLGSPDWNA